MAITTLDGLIAGMRPPREFYKIGAGTQVAGRMYSLAYATGLPGAMAAPTPGVQGARLTYYAGQLDFDNPVSGNTYLSRFAGEMTQPGTLLLCDRLWHNSGNSITSTALQVVSATINTASVADPTQITTATAHGFTEGQTVYINCPTSTPAINGYYAITYVGTNDFTIPVNVTVQGTSGGAYAGIPARDMDGTTNGEGVMAALEVSSATGAGVPTLTMAYVNSSGVAGQVSPSISLAASYPAGTFIPIPLAAGDMGVRAIKDHTKNATQTSGAYHLVLYRVIARVPVPLAAVGGSVDAITSGMPRLFDNSVPFLVVVPGTTTAPNVSGNFAVSQG